ncbi:MAG: cupin domain-containing protein [Alphaproteobacteria bacterium]|nr:cupin domain-containing protein [Alphaproteobacteria bacterium]MDE2350965.1 cupin domain-containing protein [Alphaproteobacteria bacterium]
MRDIRRIVTGHNAQGKSNITFAGIATNVLDSAAWPGSRVTELWVTEEMPVDNAGVADRGARPIRHDPVPGGTIFRVVEIPPEGSTTLDTEAVFAALGSTKLPTAEDTAKHPSMHVTNSVDYLVVISGETYMIMEDGEILLRAGDCIVQRGTKHAWSNRGNVPCIMAAILVDAEPAV